MDELIQKIIHKCPSGANTTPSNLLITALRKINEVLSITSYETKFFYDESDKKGNVSFHILYTKNNIQHKLLLITQESGILFSYVSNDLITFPEIISYDKDFENNIRDLGKKFKSAIST